MIAKEKKSSLAQIQEKFYEALKEKEKIYKELEEQNKNEKKHRRYHVGRGASSVLKGGIYIGTKNDGVCAC